MLKTFPRNPSLSRGLSLVELMIAMVAGLIVSGAALALVISVMKSNADTIKSTRLTQELRATAEIVGRDLRRARSVTDPIANVDVATKVSCNTITPAASASATCVTYGYDCVSGGGTFRAVGIVSNKIWLNPSAATCPTGASSDVKLSSDLLKINSFTVARSQSGDAFTISLNGQFANDPSATPLIRNFTQEVRIRSAAVN